MGIAYREASALLSLIHANIHKGGIASPIGTRTASRAMNRTSNNDNDNPSNRRQREGEKSSLSTTKKNCTQSHTVNMRAGSRTTLKKA
eukprot:5555822-Amphidinium_carterae.1